METTNNYLTMMHAAMARFCSYDGEAFAQKAGVTVDENSVTTRFFGMLTQISRQTGAVTVGGRPADFCETLSVLDWLCDSAPQAVPAGRYCPVGSLPGIFVRGGGLSMDCTALAQKIQARPACFRQAVEAMGGNVLPLGDRGAEIPVFPGLFLRIKSYESDGEFPASLTLLWDENILSFVRYETVYYLAETLQKCMDTYFREEDRR